MTRKKIYPTPQDNMKNLKLKVNVNLRAVKAFSLKRLFDRFPED